MMPPELPAPYTYDLAEWRRMYMQIGDRQQRMRWIGDRLLDALESRAMRDQKEIPPELSVLINKYRELAGLEPLRIQSVFQGHTLVFRVQTTLMDPKVIKELLQNGEETW